jgi:Protein of unknown function (DUF2510)
MALRSFQHQFLMPRPPGEASRTLIEAMNPAMSMDGFAVSGQTPDSTIYTARQTPAWCVVLAVVLFPIGLLFLLNKREATVTVRFVPERGGTRVIAAGIGSDRLRELFGTLGVAEAALPEPPTLATAPAAAPSIPPPRLPPAGWYEDPEGTAAHRFWDGRSWTEHTSGTLLPPPAVSL